MRGGEGYEKWWLHGYDGIQWTRDVWWSERQCMEIATHHVRLERGFKALQVFCPFNGSTSKITQLDEIHNLLGELLKNAMLKMSHLEVEKKNFWKN